jgi:hypothetical protein
MFDNVIDGFFYFYFYLSRLVDAMLLLDGFLEALGVEAQYMFDGSRPESKAKTGEQRAK